jgi:rhodanese-related sulfurtransferase
LSPSPLDNDIPEITAAELKDRVDAEETPLLVDVRESFERDIADLPRLGQIHIPMGEVPRRLGEIPRDREVVVYCRSGSRSGSVVQFLKAQGFESVINLKGGVLAWREDVDPSLTAY